MLTTLSTVEELHYMAKELRKVKQFHSLAVHEHLDTPRMGYTSYSLQMDEKYIHQPAPATLIRGWIEGATYALALILGNET